METTRKPAPAQVRLVRAFITGGRCEGRVPTESTYRVCREAGWLVEIDEWPYHAVTVAGREMVRAS